ncbi:MAG: GHKL domain-containing protein [Cellulosilyticum sp.]|nr:GHKL domain-containing protein [Cellulosilyticum sp.]
MKEIAGILFKFTDDYRVVWFLCGWIYWGIMLVILGISIRGVQHIHHKPLKTVLSIVLPIVATFYFKEACGQLGSYYAMTVIYSIIIVVTIKILDFISLEGVEYGILYTILLGYKSGEVFLPACVGFTVIVLFSSLFILAILKKNIKENIFNVWGNFAVCLSSSLLFSLSYEEVIYPIYNRVRAYYLLSNLLKISFFGVLMVGVILLNYLLIHYLKKKFKHQFIKLKELSKHYKAIEKSFLVFSIVSILFIYGLEYFMENISNLGEVSMAFVMRFFDISQLVANITAILILAAQFYVLLMLLKLSEAKKKYIEEHMEHEHLRLYHQDLKESMSQISKMNHDIKNVFLTMNHFVERSNDEEMKHFYTQQIIPFASETIQNYDLHQRLQWIQDEALRAFLYYKITQALQNNIEVKLEIGKQDKAYYGMPFIDFIRILGILIDNAVEEVIYIPHGGITIKMIQNNEMGSYIIQNTIRETQKKQGIVMGTTTKGLGRGKGLVIVKEILETYQEVVLNTYINEEQFIQNLVIYYR